MKGSPSYPVGQLQLGMWLTTKHSAPCPHVPGQGSIHFKFLHALLGEQSVFSVHSGLHAMSGSPWYRGKHLQIPLSHSVFCPQGDGLHGSGTKTSGGTILVHSVNASPVKLVAQVHIGIWFCTLHSALNPQEPGQGSLHFSVIHATFEGQSVFTTHSGRQFGGVPM